MELHRLTIMEDYDQDLFMKLYHETTRLRKSLANRIDHRRFNVTPDIVETWFEDKFIFVFNKYHRDLDPDQLKGKIIKSLMVHKSKIISKAYSEECQINLSSQSIDDDDSLLQIANDFQVDKDLLWGLLDTFFKEELSQDALLLLELELFTPEAIRNKVSKRSTSIPAKYYAEYMGYGDSKRSIKYVNNLRKEISHIIEKAREHFRTLALN